MNDSEKRIFISYRRDVSWQIARAVFLDLKYHGYDVFMDVESIDSGAFDRIIYNQIAARAHFVLILTHGSLDRCNQDDGTADPEDWLRREIEAAIDLKRNIVPLLIENFNYREAQQYLTGKLAQLPRFNSLRVPHEFFDAAMEKLRLRYLKQPVYGEITEPPTEEQVKVSHYIELATRKAPPTQDELTAERAFQLGFVHVMEKKIDEAITLLTSAIEVDPNFSQAYLYRGKAYQQKGLLDAAANDYLNAITLSTKETEQAWVYAHLGIVRQLQNDLQGALEAYKKFIELNGERDHPNQQISIRIHEIEQQLATQGNVDIERRVAGYLEAGLAKHRSGDYEGAVRNFTEAIALNSSNAALYNKRGYSLYKQGLIDAALEDYNQAILLDPEFDEAYYNRGSIRTERGDIAGAKEDYQRSSQLVRAKRKRTI